jgi:hypothetical protein
MTLNFRVYNIKKDSASIEWNLNEPVLCSLNYGLDPQKLDKYIAGGSYVNKCLIQLTALEVDTRYYIQALSTDEAGNQAVTKSSFRTALATLPSGMPDVYKIENARNFTITSDDTSLILGWDKFEMNDSLKVLILRSTDFYPTSEDDGQVIYFGKQPSLLANRHIYHDSVGLTRGLTYYYNVIMVDDRGHRSSGSINDITLSLQESYNQIEVDKNKSPIIKKPTVTPEHINKPEPSLEDLSMKDVDFIIDNKRLDFGDMKVIIVPANKIISVLISKIKLRHKVEQIVVEITNESLNQTVKLIFRPENNYYVGNIGPFAPGKYLINLGLYDKNHQLTKIVDGQLLVTANMYDNVKRELLPDLTTVNEDLYFYILLFIIILIIYFERRRRKNIRKIQG